MRQCDLTLPSPAENLACDEALLDLCEEGYELLRFWEPSDYFVVLGYANSVSREVNLPFCKANQIGVFRRCSGGGTVLQGPGCLNYSLILRINDSGPLAGISTTNTFILNRHIEALAKALQKPVKLQGQTDLTIGQLKFSGNAQRRRKHFLIFHGTFLLRFDLALIEKTLPFPSRQPDYREYRSHCDFLTNLGVSSDVIKNALIKAWSAFESFEEIPRERISQLAREKYEQDAWNLKFQEKPQAGGVNSSIL